LVEVLAELLGSSQGRTREVHEKKDMPDFLSKGAWYALEQAGHLLSTAIALYNSHERIWLAVGLGILALEEISKCSDWRERSAAYDMRAKTPSPTELIEKRHKVKQWEGILPGGITYGLAADTKVGSLLAMLAMSVQNKPQFEEIGKDLTTELQDLREKAFYVDLKDYDAGWLRPSEACKDSLACQILILASNSYASMREKLRSAFVPIEQIQVRAYELFIARGAAHGHDWADWFRAEQELNLPSPPLIRPPTDS
jgi:AbiV family abortive infection protein